MARLLSRTLLIAFLLAATSAGVWVYRARTESERQIVRLREEKENLDRVVKRLSDENRVAELLVTEQRKDAKTGEPLVTNLLFVEYTKGGVSLPPREFTIEGNIAHVDAMVIKFDRHFVAEGDPLRGRSIALFTRIFGDRESPASAARIDKPGEVPAIYRDADPRVVKFEQDLWKDFWRLADDEQFRKERGVHVAMGQGVWGMFEPGKLYTITLDSDGGLNLTSEPLKGIYREALKVTESK